MRKYLARMISGELRPRVRDVILRDGTTMRLRPPERSDVDGLLAFFGGLTEKSLYTRFHGIPSVAAKLVEGELDPDWVERGALVGSVGDGSPAEIVALASYVRLRDPAAAEVAFAVADAAQGRGVGTRLRPLGRRCAGRSRAPARPARRGPGERHGRTAERSRRPPGLGLGDSHRFAAFAGARVEHPLRDDEHGAVRPVQDVHRDAPEHGTEAAVAARADDDLVRVADLGHPRDHHARRALHEVGLPVDGSQALA